MLEDTEPAWGHGAARHRAAVFLKVGSGILTWMEVCWRLYCSKPSALLTQSDQLLPQSPDISFCLGNTVGMRKAWSSMGRQTHAWAAGGIPPPRLQVAEQADSFAQPWPSGISQSTATAPGSDTRLSPGHRRPNIPPSPGTSPSQGFSNPCNYTAKNQRCFTYFRVT